MSRTDRGPGGQSWSRSRSGTSSSLGEVSIHTRRSSPSCAPTTSPACTSSGHRSPGLSRSLYCGRTEKVTSVGAEECFENSISHAFCHQGAAAFHARPSIQCVRNHLSGTVGDPNLIALLESHHVLVDVSPPSTPWLLDLLVDWAPMLLLIAFFWWMSAKASRAQSGLFNIGRIKARRYSTRRPARGRSASSSST